eukprot:scaffold106_cov380-Prasinococcus_capsulatus_cf.AAC.48
MPLSEEELQTLYTWVDGIPLYVHPWPALPRLRGRTRRPTINGGYHYQAFLTLYALPACEQVPAEAKYSARF